MKAMRKHPKAEGWRMITINPDFTAWQKGKYCALSSLVNVHDEHLPAHDEWLISFSIMGKERCSNKDIAMLIREWEADNFEEDNHEAGIARKFWLAVDQKYRIPCPCKDEKVITEGDYTYSITKGTNS